MGLCGPLYFTFRIHIPSFFFYLYTALGHHNQGHSLRETDSRVSTSNGDFCATPFSISSASSSFPLPNSKARRKSYAFFDSLEPCASTFPSPTFQPLQHRRPLHSPTNFIPILLELWQYPRHCVTLFWSARAHLKHLLQIEARPLRLPHWYFLVLDFSPIPAPVVHTTICLPIFEALLFPCASTLCFSLAFESS